MFVCCPLSKILISVHCNVVDILIEAEGFYLRIYGTQANWDDLDLYFNIQCFTIE